MGKMSCKTWTDLGFLSLNWVIVSSTTKRRLSIAGGRVWNLSSQAWPGVWTRICTRQQSECGTQPDLRIEHDFSPNTWSRIWEGYSWGIEQSLVSLLYFRIFRRNSQGRGTVTRFWWNFRTRTPFDAWKIELSPALELFLSICPDWSS
jgi:hypothetical protein